MYLGNLTVNQIESNDYGYSIQFTDEEREYLKEHHHPKARFDKGDSGWHMFDMPRFLLISNDEVGRKVVEIFRNHLKEMVGSIEVGCPE